MVGADQSGGHVFCLNIMCFFLCFRTLDGNYGGINCVRTFNGNQIMLHISNQWY